MDKKDEQAETSSNTHEEAAVPTVAAKNKENTTGKHDTPAVPIMDRPMPSEHRIRNLALICLLILGVGSGFLGGWVESHYKDNSATNIQKQQIVLKNQGQLISKIAKNVGQSVVSVDVTGQSAASSDSFFGAQQSQQSQSAGTGIILAADGLIITNRHVVPSGTTSVSVTLSDGTQYDNVQVVGRTNSSDTLDVAFLKIQDTKGKTLVPAQLGDSSKVQVGDSVIAIGNALGQFENTVTSGIISGHGRSLQASSGDGSSSENLEDLFQTDAAINEGNSGGPLVNMDGQVIGINTAVAQDSQSLGFSIPINDVSGLIKGVEATGKLQRPYLGVMYVSLTDDLAKQYDLSVTRGAYIAPAAIVGQDPIISGGPADKAGVKAGDIITKVNNDTIDQNNSLTGLLDKHNVGDKVTLTIIRNGKQQTIDVTLGAEPSS